jgi:uncharacterized protein (TIGR03067 family)
VLKALADAGELDPGVVVVHETSRGEDESEDESEYEVWWPEDYAFEFSIFGPMWKGVPGKVELDGLSEGVRSLQGQWKPVRFDAVDGSDASEWASGLTFLLARDQLVVRQGIAVVSAARVRVETLGQVDLRPIMGSNRGSVAPGVYEFRGDALHWCVLAPDEERPAGIAPEEHQPGRMVLRREPD